MNAIFKWCDDNEMILNLKKGKTEAMLFGTAKNLSNQSDTINVVYGSEKINITTSYKYLGVYIEPSLNMNKNFDSRYKKAAGKLRLLQKLRQMLNERSSLAIYRSMIQPTLTYCGFLDLNQTEGQKLKLKRLHNRAESIIFKHKTKHARVPSSMDMVNVRSCDFVRQVLEGKVCTNFRNYFVLIDHRRSTRNNLCMVKLPRIRLEYARGSLSYSAAKLYNTLPLHIRKVRNYKDFKNF